jgi:hypothetical protein
MNSITKKIIVILTITILIGSASVAVVSAKNFSLFSKNDKPRLNDLIEKWNEIRTKKAELKSLLESYGVDVPDLTDQQKWTIWETVINLKRDGASKEEIREQVRTLLEEFGVEFPNLSDEDKKDIRLWIKTLLETEYGFVFPRLTETEKQEIKQIIIDLKEQGLTREEIKAEIKELLQTEYGFVFPELTEIEKQEIKNLIKQMLEEEYGLEFPDLTEEQKSIIKQKKEEIRTLQKELHQMLKNADRFTKLRFYRYVKNEMNPPKNRDIQTNKPLIRILRAILIKLANSS